MCDKAREVTVTFDDCLVCPPQCQVEESVSEGVGPNKKLAKRNAAESMLQLLGFSRPSPQPSKPAIKSTQSSEVSHPWSCPLSLSLSLSLTSLCAL